MKWLMVERERELRREGGKSLLAYVAKWLMANGTI